jgi:acyl carrier protein
VLTADGIENQVRRVVARHLGISSRALAPAVSLRDDFATDAQAMADIVLAVETRLGVRLHERVLDEVRSYGELVAASIEAIRASRAQLKRDATEYPTGRVEVLAGQEQVVERTGTLTPYVLETVCDDVRRAGKSATVVVTLSEPATDDQLQTLRTRLSSLERRGVPVRIVRRDPAPQR